jgi:DNA-binding NarL/FixJ family response regulator
MSSAFADPSPPTALAEAGDRHVVVVLADASCREVAHALLAGAVLRWPGTVAMRAAEDVAADHPDAIVLVADSAAPAFMAVLRRIRKELPAARLVVVARDDGNAIAARQALNAGAEAFVRADDVDQALEQELEDALAPAARAVAAGLSVMPTALRNGAEPAAFSHREREVLRLAVTGHTNGQIASMLFLAESTVKSHLAAAFTKLGVRSRKDAVMLLLDPDEGLATTALPVGATARADLRKSGVSGFVDRA